MGYPKLVFCSHHELEKANSPCTSVYQIFIGTDKLVNLQGYINVCKERDISKVLSQYKNADIAFMFNSYCSLLENTSKEILKFALVNKKDVYIYWHETAWNLRDLSKRMKYDFVELTYLLKQNHVINWVPTAQCLHAVCTLFGMAIESFRIVYEVYSAKQFTCALPTANTHLQNKKEYAIVGSGLLTARKGFDIYIWIAKQLKNCTFDWFKVTPANPSITDIKPVKLFEKVDNFAESLLKHDIFILTSRDDPSPLVALEALACGLPVFAFRSTGLNEVLTEPFLANDKYELLEKIKAYLQNITQYSKNDFCAIAKHYTAQEWLKKAFPANKLDYCQVPNLKINDNILGYDKKQKTEIQSLAQPVVARTYDEIIQSYRLTLIYKLYGAFLPKLRKPSICVVGNSPLLKGKGLGQIIDQHDIVIRINDFATKGYEADTGTKTSLVMITPAIAYTGEITQLKKKQFLIFRANYSLVEAKNRLYEKTGIVFDDCNFLDNTLYFDIQGFICKFPANVWSTGGLIALQWARDKYKTVIDYTGIDLVLTDTGIPHYHKKNTKYDHCHDFELEQKRIDVMIKNNQIKKLD